MSSLYEQLLQFTGTERWFKDVNTGVLMTQGVCYFGEHGQANWALDDMALFTNKFCRKNRNFIVFDLHSKDNKADLIVSDGDGHGIANKHYAFTDLESGHYRFYAIYDGKYMTLLLPGEY